MENKKELSLEEIESCIKTLQLLSDDGSQMAKLSEDQFIHLMKITGQLSRPDRSEKKKRNKAFNKQKAQETKNQDRQARANTGIRTARTAHVFEAPKMLNDTNAIKEEVLSSPKNCYICHNYYQKVHHFYDSMCQDCGDFNYAKRYQVCDLSGQVALITGSRLKIGYQASLKLLRSGAKVIATTRFPIDSAIRFSKEEDYASWSDRLFIHGLDLRHIPSVELFCQYFIQQYGRLDLLINNAAQTVRRPSGFYAHLMESEQTDFHSLSVQAQKLLGDRENCLRRLYEKDPMPTDTRLSLVSTWQGLHATSGLTNSAQLSQIPYKIDHQIVEEEIFPIGKLDADLQQVDLRKTNSWRLKMGEIATEEMLEVHLVNAVAPFILCNRLLPLMKKENTGKKHIVNVTAMEGKFHRFTKSERHPHTNMAKAALNMMTHTSSQDLPKFGIFMNAVDTGWVTDEDPVELANFKTEVHDFQPPLDIVDGAARVCDPFISGILSGYHWNGKFLKDYKPIDW